MDFISFLLHKKTVKQFLNNVCPCGNSSQSAGFSQCPYNGPVLILQIFYRIFHCRDQRTFCEICRRLCGAFCDGKAGDRKKGTGAKGRSVQAIGNGAAIARGSSSSALSGKSALVLFFHVFPVGSVYLPPAGFLYYASFCCKPFITDKAADRDLLGFTCRRENCQEPADYHVVDFAFVGRHIFQAHIFLRGNDGVVVRNFCIIYKRF